MTIRTRGGGRKVANVTEKPRKRERHGKQEKTISIFGDNRLRIVSLSLLSFGWLLLCGTHGRVYVLARSGRVLGETFTTSFERTPKDQIVPRIAGIYRG